LANFETALGEIFVQATPRQQALLTEWRDYAQQLRLRYAL
jgi:exodeoxyribonuclease-1